MLWPTICSCHVCSSGSVSNSSAMTRLSLLMSGPPSKSPIHALSFLIIEKPSEDWNAARKKQKVIVMGDRARCHEKRQFVRGMIALCTTHKRFWRESCFSHFYK